MAYLPGVPDAGPSPVDPTSKAKVEHIDSVVGRRGAGLTTLGGGDAGMHSLNHYGKRGSPLMNIRGGTGQMSKRIKYGGLGPEKLSRPGPSNTDYSLQQNEDTE